MRHRVEGIGDVAILLTRLLLATIFLYHGIPKLLNWSATMNGFASMGFPGILGPLVGIAEVVTSICLITGALHFLAVMVLLVINITALVTVQIPGAAGAETWLTSSLERDMLIFVSLFVLLSSGPGRLSFGLRRTSRR